jgi:hypothetical protein
MWNRFRNIDQNSHGIVNLHIICVKKLAGSHAVLFFQITGRKATRQHRGGFGEGGTRSKACIQVGYSKFTNVKTLLGNQTNVDFNFQLENCIYCIFLWPAKNLVVIFSLHSQILLSIFFFSFTV